ncbi:beta-lactamase/transpeptidase-like protein [Paraphoma chrysanthemicola]|uniref:Beta-lactamase/transpeptidase-like protein n=1 Tax=Paraphoma chrysanthemicola TaxID=798071 RepID=A0A8K0RI77_9PLEO|nr:beta-lactamase/transpeptidase-like protein [Paraphoma chrysanthemicola]
MRSSNLLLALTWTSLSSAAGFCPFLGPVFPAPKSYSSPSFQSDLTKLKSAIEDAFVSGNTTHGPVNANDTYSIQIFAASEASPILDWHRRGVDVAGNSSIGGDSIYRIASTTKLLTVYLLLLEAGDGIFNDVVTKYLPELAGKGFYDQITVGALAGYAAGIVSDAYGVDTLPNGGLRAAFPEAFPELDPDEVSPCVYGQSGCTREIFLQHIATRRQVYLPNTTPAYSNTEYAALGLILESASGKSYAEALKSLLADPLSLKATTVTTPSDSTDGVIVGSLEPSAWNLTLDGAGIGMGAAFSTANDMTAIGKAILSSSLLDSNTTRAWLQPTSHTSSLIGAVGLAWEIFRATLGPAENNRVVDLYTKSGNVGGYGANLVLVPDFGVGFVILSASRRGRVPFELSGVIVDHLLPALEEAARVEADEKYAGTYIATNGLNSSVTLSTTAGEPGLSIDSWFSNGTDIRYDPRIFGAPQHFQVYPTNIKSKDGSEESWRTSFIALQDVGPFSACPSWVVTDRPTYGVYGVDEFVFHLDGSGKVTALELKALKITLQRQ